MFRWLVRLANFPACWRLANVTPIPKGRRTVLLGWKLPTNFYNFSIVLFVWASGVGSSRTIWGTHGYASKFQPPSLLSVRSGYLWCRSWIVQIGFNTAFNRMNHQGIHCSSPLWVLEVQCCLYWHNFPQIDCSTLWWMIVWVNWLPL